MPTPTSTAETTLYNKFLEWYKNLSSLEKSKSDIIDIDNYKSGKTFAWFSRLQPTAVDEYNAAIQKENYDPNKQYPPSTTEDKTSTANSDETSADSLLSTMLSSGASRWDTQESNGYVFLVGYDDTGKIVSYDPVGSSKSTYKAPGDKTPTDPFGRTATWDEDNAEWKYSPDWGVDPRTQSADYLSPSDRMSQQQIDEAKRQFEIEQNYKTDSLAQDQSQFNQTMQWNRDQQSADLAAKKAEALANLRANPASWLEYAALAGETPAVQPWMVPLSPQDYNMNAGEALGTNLPGLQTPSAQYMARISPSAQQQYYGYEKARTGATSADTEWSLWNRAAPEGSYTDIKYSS